MYIKFRFSANHVNNKRDQDNENDSDNKNEGNYLAKIYMLKVNNRKALVSLWLSLNIFHTLF